MCGRIVHQPSVAAADRTLLDDAQAIAFEADDRALGVGQQDHVAHAEIEQDLRADAVVAQLGARRRRGRRAAVIGEMIAQRDARAADRRGARARGRTGWSAAARGSAPRRRGPASPIIAHRRLQDVAAAAERSPSTSSSTLSACMRTSTGSGAGDVALHQRDMLGIGRPC